MTREKLETAQKLIEQINSAEADVRELRIPNYNKQDTARLVLWNYLKTSNQAHVEAVALANAQKKLYMLRAELEAL